MKKHVILFTTIGLFFLMLSVFSFMTTAHADTYKTLELDDTCSIEIPSGASYWKKSGGYTYYKAGSFVIQIEMLNSKLNLSSEKSSYKSLGLIADYDYSKTSVKCVYGLDMDNRGNVYSLIGFNSKQHGIRIGVLFDIDSNTQNKYFLHIIDSIKVYDKKESKEEQEGKNGWQKEGSYWRYYENNIECIGWKLINGKYYYFNKSGNMVTGWLNDNDKWYLMSADGGMITGWVKNSGEWYYMDKDGAMRIGWLQSGKDWYLLKSSGEMATGWIQFGGTWYYFKDSGVMDTGWQQIDGTWYYFDISGAMSIGWKSISGAWYYFKNSGAMATGWFEDKEAENALPANQKRVIWYWFDNNGSMATGWKEIDGQWEMFADSGEWLYTWDGN